MSRVLLVVAVVVGLLIVASEALGKDFFQPGLCPGYSLGIPKGTHNLVITNGPRTAQSTGTCKTSKRWNTFVIKNMCSGKRFTATANGRGNLAIGCTR